MGIQRWMLVRDLVDSGQAGTERRADGNHSATVRFDSEVGVYLGGRQRRGKVNLWCDRMIEENRRVHEGCRMEQPSSSLREVGASAMSSVHVRTICLHMFFFIASSASIRSAWLPRRLDAFLTARPCA